MRNNRMEFVTLGTLEDELVELEEYERSTRTELALILKEKQIINDVLRSVKAQGLVPN